MTGSWDFEAFLTGIVPALTRYCSAITGTADGEDAAQEALIRTWKNKSRIPNEKAAAVFAYRTAYRLCVDRLRRQTRETAAMETYARQETAAMETYARQETAANQLSDGVVQALRTLSPEDRAIVYSRVMEEESYRTIAARFGKTEAWARKRYSLALRRLAVLLDEGGEA